MKTIFEIDEEGNLNGLYTDEVNLFSLGRVVNVRKASNVEFDESSQQWQVTSISGKVLYSHPNRETCIEWEIVNFSPNGLYYNG